MGQKRHLKKDEKIDLILKKNKEFIEAMKKLNDQLVVNVDKKNLTIAEKEK